MSKKRSFLQGLRRKAFLTLGFLLLLNLLAASTLEYRHSADRVRRYTRTLEFNFVTWTIDAVLVKLEQFGLGATGYLQDSHHEQVVRSYFTVLEEATQLEGQIAVIFADPSIEDPQSHAAQIILERDKLREYLSNLQPIVETLLQEQVTIVLAELGLDLGGEVFPPVAFHFTKPPSALIISPREIIRQDAHISLNHGMVLEERIGLEGRVESAMDVSALVVNVGGVGVYPTMIQESTSIVWVAEVIAHEWVHNYLSLRPLGLRYFENAQLRTMNETTANIVGKEIGIKVLKRFYPDLAPPPVVEAPTTPSPAPTQPPEYDFRAEMNLTRVTVDELLASGQIEEAEAYMEARRQFFWENGSYIRRLNQAYFAFHGAYADQPGGAAGEDPVGAAVRELWARIQTPVEFLRVMAWMNDFADLQTKLGDAS
jgi:hypothetical protein